MRIKVILNAFQFYLSSIKSENEPFNRSVRFMFQFYLSSIKSGKNSQEKIV